MKTFYNLRFKIAHYSMLAAILSLLFIIFTMNTMSAEARDGKSMLRPVEKSDGGYLTWIEHGKLYRLWIEDGRENIYIYKPKNGNAIVVSGSIHAISYMLNLELRNNQNLESVISSKLDKILFSLLTQRRTALIDKHFLNNYINTITEKPTAEAKFADTIRSVKQRIEESYLKTDGGEWDTRFFVVNQDGSVERWTASGTLKQFSVANISIETVEPKGTLILLSE